MERENVRIAATIQPYHQVMAERDALAKQLAEVKADGDGLRKIIADLNGALAQYRKLAVQHGCPESESAFGWLQDNLPKFAASEAARLKIEREAAAMRKVCLWVKALPGISEAVMDAIDEKLDSTAGQRTQRQLEAGEKLREMKPIKLTIDQAQVLAPLFDEFDAAKKGGA